MSDSKRTYHDADTKVQALRRHLIDKEKVSDICDDLGIHPNIFYEWQSKFFTEGNQVFCSSKEKKTLEKKVEKLTDQSKHKDSVIADLVTELIDLKKSLGEE